MIAFRRLRMNPGYAFINIAGLSISMAACLLIFQYVAYELGFDKQFKSNTFILGSVSFTNGTEKHNSVWVPRETGEIILNEIPNVKEVVRMSSTRDWFDCTLAYTTKNNIFNENNGFWFVDQSFLNVFNVDLIAGNAASALSAPYSLVLSATTARKYFGEDDPVGKIMRLRGSFQTHDYTVTGVMKDFPTNSHLDVNLMASFSSLPPGPFSVCVYLQLPDGVQAGTIVEKINKLASKIQPGSTMPMGFMAEPIENIHLYSALENLSKPPGNPVAVYSLLCVAALILAIAWINYVNLSSAKIISRGKEVGIRKVTGASKTQVVLDFLAETIVVNLISILIAVILFSSTVSSFNRFIGISISSGLSLLTNVQGPVILVVTLFAAGILLSGIIPAWSLARLNPVRVLKGKFMMHPRVFSFGKAAVVFQMACAFVLAVSVTVFYAQFDFMRQQELGIDITRSLVCKAPANVDSSYVRRLAAFKNELITASLIENISTSSEVPGNYTADGWGGDIRKTVDGESFTFGVNLIDHDFIALYDLKLIAGRNFVPTDFPGVHFGSKIEPVILNRTGLNRLGFKKPSDAIDQQIFWGKNICRIVGVLEDFHQRTVKEPIIPILFTANIGPAVTIKLSREAELNPASTITIIRSQWNTFFPDNAFEYFFLEDHFNAQYANDERLAGIFNLFCGLALAISFLGLFALSLFSLRLRTKEISIRKVLGAPLSGLIKLLSKEYVALTAISVGLATPLAWWIAREWLNRFSMRVDLATWYFVVPVAAIFSFVLAMLVWQALRVERNCSVDLLKED